MFTVEDVMTYIARKETWVCAFVQSCVSVCVCAKRLGVFSSVVQEFGSAESVCISNAICMCVCTVQEGLSIHTHNDMQMIISQSDANGFIITKTINTVKIKLQT